MSGCCAPGSSADKLDLNAPVSSRTPVELGFVNPATDWAPLVDAWMKAFEGSVLNERMYPRHLRPSWDERVACETRLRELDPPKSGVHHVVARVAGRPVGFATWRSISDPVSPKSSPGADELMAMERKKRDAEEAKGERVRAYERSLDGEFVGRFKDALDRTRKGYNGGKACWLLSLLCVHPDFQGRGVGGQLVNWGLAQSDSRGLPAYLETSPAGQPLYERAGFQVVSTLSWTAADGTPFSMPVMSRAACPLPANFKKPLPLIVKPDVVLSEVRPEDWAGVSRARILALRAEGVLFNSIFPRELQPDFETQVAWSVHTMRRKSKYPLHDSIFIKAMVDSRIVGSALWSVPCDRTSTSGFLSAEEQAVVRENNAQLEDAKDDVDRAVDRTVDGAFYKRWQEAADAKRRMVFSGKPHWYLETLSVHPEAQGLGVGKRLVQWGIDRADAAGLPTYLESSRRGRPLYDHLGFRSVGDIQVVGNDGTCFSLPGMVRPPAVARSAALNDSEEVILSFVDPPVDRAPLAKVRQAAFEYSDMVEHLYKTDCRPSLQERINGTIRSEFRKEPFLPPDTVRLKASIGGIPVGLAVWLAPIDRTSTSGDPLLEEAELEERQDTAVAQNKHEVDEKYDSTLNGSFVKRVGEAFEEGRKRQYGGRKHWYLTMVAVDPNFQGRGVGKKLLDWGLAQADEQGLPTYLEASHEGVPLYASRGFKTVAELDLSEGVVHPAMERLPRPLPKDFKMPSPLMP